MVGIAILFMCCKSDHSVHKASGINGTWLYSSFEVDTMSAKNKDLSAGSLAAAVIMNDSNWRVSKLVIKDSMFVSFKKDGTADTAIYKKVGQNIYSSATVKSDSIIVIPTTDTTLTFMGYGVVMKFKRYNQD